MTPLTTSLRRSITSDWKKCFESLDVYKPMWLGRVVGPFFQGICLEKNSGNASYLPTSHIHCLCRDFPVVSLTLGQRLLSPRSGTQERISVQFHEAHFMEAAGRLKSASLLPLAGIWGLQDLILAVEAYRRLERPDSKYPIFPFEDVVMAAIWLGDLDQAHTAIIKYETLTSTWPENIFARYGGRHVWIENLKRLIGDPNVLRQAAQNHAEKLKVIHLPRVDMRQP